MRLDRDSVQKIKKIELTDPNYSYLMGFLQADGSKYEDTRNRGRISVELSLRDSDLIYKLADLIPCPSHISFRSRTTNFTNGKIHDSITLKINWLEFRNRMTELGLPTGVKSHLVAPPAVPFIVRDYMRGLIDGDGSVGLTSKGLPFISLITNSEFIKDFVVDQTEGFLGYRKISNRNQRDQVFNPMLNREDAVIFATWLYQEGDLALDRKMDAARLVKDWIRPIEIKRRGTK